MASRSVDDPISAFGLGVASFTNKILIGHPCTVLRRQAQIHKDAKKSHLTPFSLIPVACQLISKDGVLTLWKGSVGSGVLWAMSHLAELVIADVFSLPKTVIQDGSRERFWRHVLLKASSYLAMTPFIVSSFVETVRTGTDIDTRIFEVVFRGLDRLRFDLFGTKDSTKRINIIYLSIRLLGSTLRTF
uniref:Uncharacterized protein n=1 Tax=Ditylenchus dipsaci TaxID=166011 RepID=A0A915ECY0_9BILA